MFTQNFEAFIESYSKSTPEIKELVDSGRIGDTVMGVLVDGRYDAQRPVAIVISTYLILSIINDDTFLSELIQLQIDPETIKDLHTKIGALVKNPQVIETSSEIAAMENLLKNLPQKPTETTYTSTQSAILNEGSSSGQWGTQ